MTIDPDVQVAAHQFGLDPKLIQAVVNAEGGNAIVRAVQCSIPSVTTRAQALDVVCRSCVHAMCDFLVADDNRQAFVTFWGERWAPTGVANDPTNLNQYWPKNVMAGWLSA